MNPDPIARAPVVFLAGAAHVDRRGRSKRPFGLGASNPGTMKEAGGGAAFNAAAALRRLGAEVRLVSARGGDGDGRLVEAALAELGIEDLALTWLDRRTPTYTALLDHTGDLVGGLADMVLYDFMQPRVFARRHIREALDTSDALMVDANIPSRAIRRLVEMAQARPTTAIGVSPAKVDRLAPVLPLLSAVFLSRAEAGQLADAPDAPVDLLARRLSQAGCRRAVVTDGPGHAAILDGGVVLWQAPAPVAALRDVTGAGDTLAAVATHALVAGRGFVDAARLGMAAASLHVSIESGGLGPDDIRAAAARMRPAQTRQPEEANDAP